MSWIGVIITVCAVAYSSFALGYTHGTHNWELEQRFFPCAEDEVLGYVPGEYDLVRCMSREEVGG